MEIAILIACYVCCRRNYNFAREWNEGGFYGHQYGDGPVVHMFVVPINYMINHARIFGAICYNSFT